MNTILTSPKLIEPGVRYFLSGTLKECRKFKDKNSSILLKTGKITVGIVIGIVLMSPAIIVMIEHN